MAGLIHIYCGDGKGKTTAAVGISVRAAGAGVKVVFAQFFKDGSSSELKILSGIENVETVVCRTRYGFYRYMDDETREKARRDYTGVFEKAAELASEGAGLLVLDEIISACNHGMVSGSRLLEFLSGRPEGLEVVLTGRGPSEELMNIADYVTEMRKIKHPYDRGISARPGIEY